MENNYIVITINGTEYYIQADRINDLAYIDNKLVNVSNSSITLVSSFDIQNTYPRITCGAMQQCRLQSSNNVNYVAVTSNYEFNGNYNLNMLGSSGKYNVLIVLLFIVVGLNLLWKR